MRKKILATMLSTLAMAAATAAHAVPITFDLAYAGIDNAATGTGSITFDDAVLPNPGALFNVSAATLGVTAFSITISGAATGNGTFGLSQVTNWIWNAAAPLDLTGELVGQAGLLDFNWCGFLFDGCSAPAPGGTAAFIISTNAETGNLLQLTSMRRVTVSEPGTMTVLGLGLFAMGFLRRKVRR